MTPESIARLSSLFDEVADLTEPACEARLAAMAGDDAALVPRLRRMLAARGGPETANLLARGPAFAVPEEPAAFAGGDTVGPYRLQRRLGEGGMGEVWLAERQDGRLRRSVALKLPMLGLRRQLLAQRFARERDILAALQHPHIAGLYDAGEAADGQPWLALEFVDGTPITEHVRGRALDARATVRLMLQVLGAVQHAHANLVIHRDLKPSNVLVTAEGRAMLLDFGIAKLLQEAQSEAGETELTRVGGRALTPAYAAPEQLSGAPVSIATDIGALGVLLYELLAGERPFAGERHALERAILEAEPRPLRGVPADLCTVVLKALKKAPAERYATVAAFGDDLQRWLDGQPVRAQPDSRWYRTHKFVVRNRVAVGAGTAVFAAVVAAAGVSLWQADVAREQARIAQTEARTAQAVQDFLEGIFRASGGSQADPLAARQRTALQLLDEGAARIDQALDDAPQAKLRVLLTLASIFDDMGETERMAHMLARRVEVVHRLVGSESAEMAQAQAELAMAQAVVGRDADAQASLRRAEQVLAPLPDADDDAHIAVEMAVAQFHAARGDARGLDAARRLTRRLQSHPPSLDVTDALMLRGKLERFTALPAEAVQTLERAIAVARHLPGGGENALGVLYTELGLAESDLGQPDAAVGHLRDALRVFEKNAGPAAPSTLIALSRLGQVLTEQGRPDEAVQPLMEARRRIDADPALAGKPGVVGVQRFHEGQARRRLGQLDLAARCYRESLAVTQGPEGNADGALRAALGLVMVLAQQRRVDEAARLLNDARALREKADLRGHGQALMLAQAEMALAQARADDAAAVAAWRTLEADPGTAARREQAPLLALQAQAVRAASGPAAAATLARELLSRLQAAPPLPNARYAVESLRALAGIS